MTSTLLSTSCDGRKRGLYSPFQKQEGTWSFLPAQGLARGVGSMTVSQMEHGAKPPGSFLSTPCFLPIKRLRLRPLGANLAGKAGLLCYCFLIDEKSTSTIETVSFLCQININLCLHSCSYIHFTIIHTSIH